MRPFLALLFCKIVGNDDIRYIEKPTSLFTILSGGLMNETLFSAVQIDGTVWMECCEEEDGSLEMPYDPEDASPWWIRPANNTELGEVTAALLAGYGWCKDDNGDVRIAPLSEEAIAAERRIRREFLCSIGLEA
jgi:hypothetical protein